jgi:hypothetical protein
MRLEREYIEGPTIKGMVELGLIVRWYIYHLLFRDYDLDFFMIIGSFLLVIFVGIFITFQRTIFRDAPNLTLFINTFFHITKSFSEE